MRRIGSSAFPPLVALACLAFLLFLSPASAQAAAKLTFAFSGLGSGATAKISSIDVNGNWDVKSTDSAGSRNKSLGAGTYSFTVDVTAGNYAVSTVTSSVGTISSGTFPNDSHTSASYHNSYTFNYTVGASDTTITMVFVPRYTLKSSVSNGTLTLSNGNSAAGLTYWAQNESASITATADAGYGLETFVIGSEARSVTGYPTSQGFVTAPITKNMTDDPGGTSPGISATFVRIYTLSTDTDQGGTIGAGVVEPAGPVRVKTGGSYSFTVKAAAGSKILKVTIDGTVAASLPSSPYTYTFSNVGADHTIKAWFQTPAVNIKNYCVTPPFLSDTLKPNLLLMLDNSASMYDIAYNNTAATTYCYDKSYNKLTPTYAGNFDTQTAYSYNFTTQQFDVAASSTKPSGCNYSTAYFCLKTDGAGAVTEFWAKGDFLNWLSASKLDQQKRILTGGKYDATSKVLISESRGCVGRRFVKEVPSDDWVDKPGDPLVFGVRGPNSYDSDYVSQSTQGGKTRIEIFKGNYNATACNNAVTDWTNPDSQGAIQQGGTNSNTAQCLGSTGGIKATAYNHAIHLCYRSLTGATNAAAEINPLKNDCETIYSTIYSNDPSNITNENAGDAICASSLWHPLSNDATPDSTGYIGQCWTRTEDPVTHVVSTSWDDTCVTREINHYCSGAHAFDVTDPSDAAQIASTSGTATIVPSFIIDAGLAALGAPVATMLAHVSLPTPPQGLIQEFKDVIRFGTMQFNLNGGGTETCDDNTVIKCTKVCKVDANTVAEPYKECYSNSDCPGGTTCGSLTSRDGGRIVSYHTDTLGIGSHSADGVIKRIDDMAAGTWTPLAEAFYTAIGYYGHRSDMRLNDSDTYDYSLNADLDPSKQTCRDNYALITSDGGSTVDHNATVNALATAHTAPGGSSGLCTGAYKGSKNLDDLVYLARTGNIRRDDYSNSGIPNDKRNHILTYVINTGKEAGASTDECLNPGLLLNRASRNGTLNGTDAPVAKDAATLANSMRDIFSKVASRITSGTAASILSNSEGSGANLLQAIFYPMKTFDNLNTMVSWIGELQDFWYYIDPFIGNSTVREDTVKDGHMNLKEDWVAQFSFNKDSAQTEVYLTQDTDGNGLGDTLPPVKVSSDDVKSLWRAGRELWLRSPDTRKIYTTKDGASLVNFTSDGLGTNLSSVYRDMFQASSQGEADAVISYVRGADSNNFRSREVIIPGLNSGNRSVWKLGDIIASTPRVQSSNKLNMYQLAPPSGYNDISYDKFTATAEYKNRGMAYVGANDGMLHAFKAGKLTTATSGDEKARLEGGSDAEYGKLAREEWAFIPRNAIPYLTYLTDPGYPHVYFVDGTPTIADVSINGCGGGIDYWDCPKNTSDGSNWRTVVIGGMGLGGASKNKGVVKPDSVNTPLADIGYSSYFALDVTDQTFDSVTGKRPQDNAPTLLWEFADERLGYATSGPAIVRIATTTDGHVDNSKNGRWFAVFASGPTGSIDVNKCQFRGKSDQHLMLFVVDLKATPPLVEDTNYWVIDTGIDKAFAGSISGGVIDADRWNRLSPGFYSDDAIYVGYVSEGDGTFNEGGVLRVNTKELVPSGHNGVPWTVSKVIDRIGPVTTNISRLQDRKNHNLWLYFGTGRYFFNGDDMDLGRKLYGIKDQCYTTSDTINKDCTTSVAESDLTDQSGDTPSDTLTLLGNKGWYIGLDAKDDSKQLGAERAVTDAVAMTNGAVFFTTYKPTTDACQYGGKSRMWGVKYDTGGKAPDPALQGKALVQISTGEFKEIDLKNAFTAKAYRTMGVNDEMTGKPPGDPPPIVTKANLKPVKKILHIQEH